MRGSTSSVRSAVPPLGVAVPPSVVNQNERLLLYNYFLIVQLHDQLRGRSSLFLHGIFSGPGSQAAHRIGFYRPGTEHDQDSGGK